MTTMYGIANCDTIKKAKKHLDSQHLSYDFHDYKKSGIDTHVLAQALREHGIDTVVNKRGTTFRKLPEDVKLSINDDNVEALLSENPSMIKRPILLHKGKTYVGFSPASYNEIFNID